MHAHHDKPASFHSSPQEAMQAAPEEFLYLVCLHEGTGVEKPDFLAVVDAETGRIGGTPTSCVCGRACPASFAERRPRRGGRA